MTLALTGLPPLGALVSFTPLGSDTPFSFADYSASVPEIVAETAPLYGTSLNSMFPIARDGARSALGSLKFTYKFLLQTTIVPPDTSDPYPSLVAAIQAFYIVHIGAMGIAVAYNDSISTDVTDQVQFGARVESMSIPMGPGVTRAFRGEIVLAVLTPFKFMTGT